MSELTFVEHDGTTHRVAGNSGLSLMEIAIKHDIPGIDADCGGACACATCHVKVEAAFSDKLTEPTPMEESMLDFVTERTTHSRLSCQIIFSADMDGLVVRLPEYQG